MEDKKKISYYKSFFDVSKQLNKEQFFQFNMAIYEVLFYEKHIDSVSFSDQLLNLLWTSVKHSMQSSIYGYCGKQNIDYNELFKGVTKGVTKGVANNEKEKEKEKEKENNVAIDEYFEKVWKWYKENTSRPIGNKPEAKKRFNAQFKKLGIDNIRKALICYLRECKRTDIFTKHLSSLLNQDLSQYIDDNENEQPRKSNALTIDKIKIVS